MYLSALSQRRMLVLLDNAADEAQIRPLLPGGSGCLALITSRRWLAALEGAHLVPLDTLAEPAAIALIGKLIGAERAAREAGAAADLVRLCGNLPLALCIAGGRLAARRHWSIARLAERLSDERGRLDELAVGDRAVRASFNLSYQYLDLSEQRVFRLLGLIEATDFPAWLAAALLTVEVDEAEDMLERLVEIQLLEPGGSADEGLPRYRFHDLIRVFARELAVAEEPTANRSAAIEAMVDEVLAMGELAWAMEPGAAAQSCPPAATARWATQQRATVATAPPGGVDWFRTEVDLFVTTQQQAHRAGLWAATWQVAGLLATFFNRHAHGSQSELTKNLALDAARQAGDRHAEAAALRYFAVLYLSRAAWDQAADRLRQARDIYVELGDREGEFESLLFTGVVRRDQGRFAEAVSSFRRCLEIAGGTDRHLEVAGTEYNLAFALREQGLWDDARTYFESALVAFRAINDQVAQARIMYGLAVVHRYQHRLDQAAQMLVDAEALARSAVDDRWVTIILLGQGRIRCQQGGLREGAAVFEECLARFVDIGDRMGEAHALRSLGIALRDQDAGQDALACLRRSLDIFTAVNDTRSEARVRHSIGIVAYRRREYDEAQNAFAESLAISCANDDLPWQARTLNRLGLLAAKRQDHTAANGHWAAADRALDGLQAAGLAADLRETRPPHPGR
jgi:tetratricopeptide (TPR) repeat protein